MASTAVPGSEAAAANAAKKVQPKERLLHQIKSLDADDDVRTSISKKVSWILRHGARQSKVKQSKERWVMFSDLCQADILNEHGEDLIWQVVIDFNGKKLRYQIEDDADGRRIRAYKRQDLKEMESSGIVSGGTGLRNDAPEFTPAAKAAGGATPASPQAAAWPPAQAQAAAYAAQMGMYQQAAASWFGGYPMMQMNPMMWQQAAAAASGKYTGRIKSFSEEKGYGFIECPQTHARFQRDVFLHKAQMGDLEVGATVLFTCEESKKGMPQAKDLQALPGGGGKGKMVGKDGAKGKGAGKGKEGKRKGKGEGKGGKKDGDKVPKEEKEKKDKEDKGEKKEASEEAPGAAAAS